MKQPENKTKQTFIPLVLQFGKFGIVGVLNTGVDFLVLNILLSVFSVYSGLLVIVFNTISFSAAVINSYFLNKYWTFQNTEKEAVGSQFGKFLFVSLIGLIINTTIVFGLTTFVSPPFSLSVELWANGAKILATLVAFVWNFIGYKLWAFSDNE